MPTDWNAELSRLSPDDPQGLAEFLLARIAEDEAAAQEAGERAEDGAWVSAACDVGQCAGHLHTDKHLRERPWLALADCMTNEGGGFSADVVGHIARWDPARVLAECEARRRLVESCRHILFQDPFRQGDYWRGGRDAAEGTLRLLALPYASHDDYRPEWSP